MALRLEYQYVAVPDRLALEALADVFTGEELRLGPMGGVYRAFDCREQDVVHLDARSRRRFKRSSSTY
jgi:hypothetical protein